MSEFKVLNTKYLSPKEEIDYLANCHNEMEFQEDSLINRRNIRDIGARIDNLIFVNPDLKRPVLKKYE